MLGRYVVPSYLRKWGAAFLAAWIAVVPGIEGRTLTLEESVQLSLEHNEDLLLAQADLQKSKQRVREVRADGLPSLNLAVDYDRNWLLSSFVFAGNEVKIGTDNNITGTLRLRQPLYTGGRVSASRTAAHLSRELAGDVERSMRQDVVGRVAKDFYEVLLAGELVRVSDQALVTGSKNLQQVQALKRAGRASNYDLLRAEVQVANLRADSLQVRNLWEVAHMNLKNTVGLDLDQVVEVSGDFREVSQLDLDDVEALVQLGLSRRPQMQLFERRLHLQERTIQVEKAALRPSVDLVASGQMQFQSDSLNVFEEEWRKSWVTGIVVSVPLFNGMRARARVAQAKIDLHQVEVEREQVEKQVRLQIRQAWLEVREAGQRVQVHVATVEQAQRGLGIAESRYAAGVGTQLEMLDAQLTLVRSQTEYATARRDRALALVHLERVTGVLDETLAK